MSVGVPGGTEGMRRAFELRSRQACERECAAVDRCRWIAVAVAALLVGIAAAFALCGLTP